MQRCYEIEGGVVFHSLCACWRIKVVMTRRRILGSVAGSPSGVHRMSLGLAVVRMRYVAIRRSRC